MVQTRRGQASSHRPPAVQSSASPQSLPKSPPSKSSPKKSSAPAVILPPSELMQPIFPSSGDKTTVSLSGLAKASQNFAFRLASRKPSLAPDAQLSEDSGTESSAQQPSFSAPPQSPILEADVPLSSPTLKSHPFRNRKTSATKVNPKSFKKSKPVPSIRASRTRRQSPDADIHPPSNLSGYSRSNAFSKRFFTIDNKQNWKLMSQRGLLGERTLNLDSFKGTGVVELLTERNMLRLVTKPRSYVSSIVYEFYANLSPDIVDISSPKYMRVYVRGRTFNFSHTLINNYFETTVFSGGSKSELDIEEDLDAVVYELTGSDMSWPSKSNLSAAKLTTKYSVLLRIVLCNLFPKCHSGTLSPCLASLLYRIGIGAPVDVGKLIFERIVHEANSHVTRNILGYPSLIYELLMEQKDIKGADEPLTVLQKPLTVSDKLMHGDHLVDIQGERVDSDAPHGANTNSAAASVATDSDSVLPMLQKVLNAVSVLQTSQRDIRDNLMALRTSQQQMLAAQHAQAAKIDVIEANLSLLLAGTSSVSKDTTDGIPTDVPPS